MMLFVLMLQSETSETLTLLAMRSTQVSTIKNMANRNLDFDITPKTITLEQFALSI